MLDLSSPLWVTESFIFQELLLSPWVTTFLITCSSEAKHLLPLAFSDVWKKQSDCDISIQIFFPQISRDLLVIGPVISELPLTSMTWQETRKNFFEKELQKVFIPSIVLFIGPQNNFESQANMSTSWRKDDLLDLAFIPFSSPKFFL